MASSEKGYLPWRTETGCSRELDIFHPKNPNFNFPMFNFQSKNLPNNYYTYSGTHNHLKLDPKASDLLAMASSKVQLARRGSSLARASDEFRLGQNADFYENPPNHMVQSLKLILNITLWII
ncbi:hypothetical protein MTR_5g048770 [Medicago truncatula]|uniref:Uncharacterized protein n=1 Tax=Medicago truncatula TaxID=3880 RepID=A0A072UE51_MEDTR|nr:hypothetical protein MTR_5g048770 [Medicago truncatula]